MADFGNADDRWIWWGQITQTSPTTTTTLLPPSLSYSYPSNIQSDPIPLQPESADTKITSKLEDTNPRMFTLGVTTEMLDSVSRQHLGGAKWPTTSESPGWIWGTQIIQTTSTLNGGSNNAKTDSTFSNVIHHSSVSTTFPDGMVGDGSLIFRPWPMSTTALTSKTEHVLQLVTSTTQRPFQLLTMVTEDRLQLLTTTTEASLQLPQTPHADSNIVGDILGGSHYNTSVDDDLMIWGQDGSFSSSVLSRAFVGALGSILMASVATNSVILFTILCRNYLRRTSFILYLSLATSDLLASLFSLPVVMLVVLDMEAVRPSVGTCTLNTASVVLTSYVSVGSIASISAVRGWQFHNFSETRDQEKYTVRFIIFLLWTSGLGITIAFIFREMMDGNEMCSPQHLTKSYRSTLPLTCASITSGLLTVTLVNQLTIRKIQNSSMYPQQDRKKSSSQIQKLARRIRKSPDPPDYINSDVTTLGGYSLFPARDSLSSRGRGEAKSHHWLKTRRFSLSTVDTVDEFIEQGSRWTERQGNFLYNRKMYAPTRLLYHKTEERSIEKNDEPGHSTIVPRRRRYTESAPARLKRSSNAYNMSRHTEADSMYTVYPSQQTHNSTVYPSQQTHNSTVYPSQQTHNSTVYPSQQTHNSTVYPSQQTHNSTVYPSQQTHNSTVYPSQQTHNSKMQSPTKPLNYLLNKEHIKLSQSSTVSTSSPLTSSSLPLSSQSPLPSQSSLLSQLPTNLQPTLPPLTTMSRQASSPQPNLPTRQLSSTPQSKHPPSPPPVKPKLQLSQPPPTQISQPKLHPSPPSPSQQQQQQQPQPQPSLRPQQTPQQPSQPRIQSNPSPPHLQPPVLISSNGEDDVSFHGPPIFKTDDHSGSEVEMDHLGDVFEPLDIQESVPATQKHRPHGQDIEGPSVRTQLPNVIEGVWRGDQGPLLHNTTLIDIAVAPPDDHEVNTAAWRSDILDNIPASTGKTNPVDVWEKRQQQGVRGGSLKRLRKIDGAITAERDPWPLLTVLPKVDPQMPGTAEDHSQSMKQSDSEDNPRNQSDSHTQTSEESDSQEGSQNQSNGHTQTPKHSDSKVSSQKLSRDHKYTQKLSQTQGRNSKQIESHDNILQQLGNTEKKYKNQKSRGEELRQTNINNRKMKDSYNSNENRTNKQSDTQTIIPNESSDKKETHKQTDSIEETFVQFDTTREKSRQPDARKEKPKPTYDPQTSNQSDTQKVTSSPVSMTSTITSHSLKTLEDDSSIGYLGDLSDHPESPPTTPHQKLSREQRTERIKVLNSLSRTASRMEAIVDSDDSDDEDDVRSRIRPSTTQQQAERVNMSQLDGQQTEAMCTNQVMENAAHSVTRECVKTSRCLVAIFSLAYLPLLLLQLLVTLAPNSITLYLTVSYQAFLNAIHPAVLVYNNQLLRNSILKWCRCLAPFNKFARKVQPLENLIPRTVPLEDNTSGTLPLDKLVPSTRNIGNLLSKTIPVDNLLPKSIPVDKLLPNTISVDKLLPNSIPVDKFLPKTISVDKLLPKTISVDKLLPKSIPVGKLIPKTIPLDKLVPRRVPLGELVSNTIPL
ncbi:hypothetical protein Pmani_011769 [Petrolisthes manimaculis]|uniref:G-protein coupled receptors family 1 profile domain-containing protein n=1 Tax=Petrolisthes manimaculis TaxID=1843537 RepID=A0AAE1UFC3_9EUCA|nr:hypothetical protein Pmani_011769 [Petrolisthes manimaculis]